MQKIKKWDEVNGNTASDKKMLAFLESATDSYAILQLRCTEETALERFSSMKALTSMGLTPDIDHYEVVYTAPLLPYTDPMQMLEETYTKFNVERPADFMGHSLSVSDIVALREGGKVSCYYVDSIGFQELPHFLKAENHLRSAELSMEDDYGMIDGMINNGRKEIGEPNKSGFTNKEKELESIDTKMASEKASVLEQLKAKQTAAPSVLSCCVCKEKER